MRVWVPSWLLEEKNVTSTRDGIRTDFWESVLNQAFNAEIALYFVNQDCFKMSHLTALIHISILLFLAIQWHKNYVVKNSSSCCSCILGVCHFPQLLLWPCAWMSTIPLLCSPRITNFPQPILFFPMAIEKVVCKAFYTHWMLPQHMWDLRSGELSVINYPNALLDRSTGVIDPLPVSRTLLIWTAWVALLCKCLETASKVLSFLSCLIHLVWVHFQHPLFQQHPPIPCPILSLWR